MVLYGRDYKESGGLASKGGSDVEREKLLHASEDRVLDVCSERNVDDGGTGDRVRVVNQSRVAGRSDDSVRDTLESLGELDRGVRFDGKSKGGKARIEDQTGTLSGLLGITVDETNLLIRRVTGGVESQSREGLEGQRSV